MRKRVVDDNLALIVAANESEARESFDSRALYHTLPRTRASQIVHVKIRGIDSHVPYEVGRGDVGNRDPRHCSGVPEVLVAPALLVLTLVAVPIDTEALAHPEIGPAAMGVPDGVPPLTGASMYAGSPMDFNVPSSPLYASSDLPGRSGFPTMRYLFMCSYEMMLPGLPMLGYAAPAGSVQVISGGSGVSPTRVAPASAFTPARPGKETEPAVSRETAALASVDLPCESGLSPYKGILVPKRNVSVLDPQAGILLSSPVPSVIGGSLGTVFPYRLDTVTTGIWFP
eukprot:IDg7342t1